jgi:exopolysaccharide production protein ExoZ
VVLKPAAWTGKKPGLTSRALAALCVAYFHSYIALRIFSEGAEHPISFFKDWGFLGVNFFFAISGYVICVVVSRPTITLRSFIIRRLFRLFPMYWVAMSAVAFMILIGRYPQQDVGHFLYSMTLLPQQGTPSYEVSWTLEREVVFYALAGYYSPNSGDTRPFVLAGLAFAGFWYGNPWPYHLVSTI